MTQDNLKIPRHVAIIMDGNGRWAEARGLPRTAGHREGVKAVKRCVEITAEAGIEYLTLFGFSTENWARPVQEVSELMHLLRFYLRSETSELHRNNIRLRVIGDRTAFEKDIIHLIENAESLTESNTGLTVCVALNYGGRHDILNAASQWAQACQDKNMKPDYRSAELYFTDYLMTGKDIPDPDLLIRTSGEQRISNFLLWQCAYAELFFTETYWPDFAQYDLDQAIKVYQSRDRRFGSLKTKEQQQRS